MSSRFVTVNLAEWDMSKVSVDTEGGNVNVLYDGLIPLLKVRGVDTVYLLTSKGGLAKKNKFDMKTNKPSKDWAGSWEVSFKIADKMSVLRSNAAIPDKSKEELEKIRETQGEEVYKKELDVEKKRRADRLRVKLVDVIEDIATRISEATGEEVEPPLSYRATYTVNKMKQKKKSGVDRDDYAYLPLKVGFTADEDAPKMKEGDKEVPVLEARRPKGKYYNMAKAKDDTKVEDPETECAVPMRAVPVMHFCSTVSKDKRYLAKSLISLYFEKDNSVKPRSDAEDMRSELMGDKEIEDIIPDLD